MTSRTGNNAHGFVLAELLVVLMIMGLGIALSVPALRRAHNDAQFQAAVRNVASRLAYAHRAGVMRGAPVRVAVNIKDRSTWLEVPDSHGDFAPMQSSLAREKGLPDSVDGIEVKGPDVNTGDDLQYVTFFPDGTARAREILIRNEDETIYKITVHPATGAVAAREL